MLETIEKLNVMQMNIPGGFSCYYGDYPAADASVFLLADNRIGFLTYHHSKADFLETYYSAGGQRNSRRLKIWLISLMKYGLLVRLGFNLMRS